VSMQHPPGLPHPALKIRGTRSKRKAIGQYVDSVMDWLERQPPGIVVIAAANRAIDQPETQLVDTPSMQIASTEGAKAAIWSASLTRTLTTLRTFGHHVIMITMIPHFGSGEGPYWNPADCSLVELARSTSECGVSVSRAAADEAQQPNLAAEATAARLSGISTLDLRSILCPQQTCATNSGESWNYRDGLHISVARSRALASLFQRAVIRSLDK
jgi:hypothetical protein